MKFDGLEWHKKESKLIICKIRYFFSLKGTEYFEMFGGVGWGIHIENGLDHICFSAILTGFYLSFKIK